MSLINMKHTNKMTDEEIQEEIEQLEKFEAHVSDLAYLRLTNLRNEQTYRKSLTKEEL